ncbi:23S rRNA (guanosine(2251)-2'-O)-methyltransferase RlmB [Salinispira pacifica]
MDRRRSELVAGYHAIEEYLKRGVGGTLWVLRRDEAPRRVRAIEELALSMRVSVREVRDVEELAAACGVDRTTAEAARGALLQSERSPQSSGGGPMDWHRFKKLLSAFEEAGSLIVVLDGVTDVHNLGAILRSADQFAVPLVVIPSHGSAGRTEAVGKVSAGASAHVPVAEVKNLTQALELIKEAGFWVYGAEAGGDQVWSVTFGGRVALVMGSEGKGLSRLVREHCDALVSIPARGQVDSFNVSVAAGILMYEVRRQQWLSQQTSGQADSQR